MNKRHRILTGLLLIAVGTGYLGDIFKVWEFTIFFPGWWTLFLIVPAVYSLLDHGVYFSNIFVLLLGAYYLADANGWIPFRLTFAAIAAICCICVGVRLLFKRRVKWYDYGCKD